MRLFKTWTFHRWASRAGLTDGELFQGVEEMRAGLIDAYLGGGVVKKRIRRPGQGKRGSYRTLLATNLRDRWLFLFGFAKKALSRSHLMEIDHGKQEAT